MNDRIYHHRLLAQLVTFSFVPVSSAQITFWPHREMSNEVPAFNAVQSYLDVPPSDRREHTQTTVLGMTERYGSKALVE